MDRTVEGGITRDGGGFGGLSPRLDAPRSVAQAGERVRMPRSVPQGRLARSGGPARAPVRVAVPPCEAKA